MREVCLSIERSKTRQISVILTPPINSIPTSRITNTQRDSSLIEQHMDISCWWSCNGTCSLAVEGRRTLDFLNCHAGAERLHVWDDELLVFGNAGGWKVLGELSQSQCGEDAHDVCVVGEIKVQCLVERECSRTVVESRVLVCNERRIGLDAGETSNEFVDPTDSNGTAGGRSEGYNVRSELKIGWDYHFLRQIRDRLSIQNLSIHRQWTKRRRGNIQMQQFRKDTMFGWHMYRW